MLKPFNSTEGNVVQTGLVLVHKSTYSDKFNGVKVLDYAWVNVGGVETKFYAVQYGSVIDNEFVLEDAKNTDTVSWFTAKNVQSLGYNWSWTKDPAPAFKAGEFLTDKDGKNVFFYEDKYTVWKVGAGKYNSGATYASMATRISEFGELKVYTTTNGTLFRKLVENVDKS